jgi:hypothetical protein
MVSRAFIADKVLVSKPLLASIKMPLDSDYDNSLKSDQEKQKLASLDASKNPFWGLKCFKRF